MGSFSNTFHSWFSSLHLNLIGFLLLQISKLFSIFGIPKLLQSLKLTANDKIEIMMFSILLPQGGRKLTRDHFVGDSIQEH